MSLEKAIKYGKTRRKPYHGSKAVDSSCRNHGSCAHCACGRRHKAKRQEPVEDIPPQNLDYSTFKGTGF